MIKTIFSKYKYQFLLFSIVFILFLVNYKPGTYLSGWDSLQTELNPGLAVKRAFFSVWEEYQSFGLTAGMAHAADLVRASLLWVMAFFVPQNMIRYFYHFLMLLLGGLGMFELLGGGVVAFLGAFFYLFNLGTVQIFYLPFESFSTFFAFLPWGIWSFIKLLKTGPVSYSFPSGFGSQKVASTPSGSLNPRHPFLVFFLINLLGIPSFYTQQLFVVYILILGCVALAKFLDSRFRGNDVKAVFFAFLLIFFINSFWILPQIYFLKTNDNWVTRSKANQTATEDTLYQNLEKGTLNNFLRLEGFYFDLRGIHNAPLFAPWRDHFNGFYRVLPYLFVGLGMLGLFGSLGKRKNLGFLLILLLSALVLLSATPPFSWVNIWLRQNSFINQMFRSPFTKFIIPYSLVYSYFVAQGINNFYHDRVKSRNNFFPTIVFIVLVFLYSLPSFMGFYISPEMKVKIPQDYFQVMDYFKTEDKNKRVALLPNYTFWGWFFNKWGYNGSGFLWYGIEQPIVSRTFDVWSPKSESYFWEEKQALEAENLTQFEKVIDKYNIDYFLLDYSLIPVVSSYKSLATDRIENLLSQSQKISLVFRGETVALYQVSHPQKTESFVSLSSGLKNIGPQVKLMTEDSAYQENGNYISGDNYDIYYPFADLTTQTRIKDKKWSLEELTSSFAISSNIALNPDDYKLYLPPTSEASISNDQGITDLKLNLNPFYEDKKIKINFEKLLVKSFDVSGFNNNLTEFTLAAPELPQKYGYLIKIRSRNIRGSPLFFYVIDETKKQSMLEEKLRNESEYFILPHKFDYGLGYSFVFQNKSYENYPSENILKEVSIYLFPYKELKNAKFINKNQSNTQFNFSNNFQVKKINYFTYKVSKIDGNVVILNQSYDDGWIAYADGKPLEHVLINNWANGWKLVKTSSTNSNQPSSDGLVVTIIFWPQYLEFAGLGLLALVIIYLLFKEKYGRKA